VNPSLTFTRIAVAPLDAIGESWRRIRDQYWLFVGISAFGILLASVAPLGLLMGPMMCGIYSCYRDKWQGRRPTFERVFAGFSSPILGQSLIGGLILMALTMVVILPCVVIGVAAFITLGVASGGRHEPPPALFAIVFIAGTAIFLALILLINTLLLFVFPLIADRRLSALDAVRLSARAGFAHMGGLLGLTLVTMAIAMVGACMCYVGAFLVLPVSFGAQMIVYERIFGLVPEPETLTT
jgi:hypothetical protein